MDWNGDGKFKSDVKCSPENFYRSQRNINQIREIRGQIYFLMYDGKYLVLVSVDCNNLQIIFLIFTIIS